MAQGTLTLSSLKDLGSVAEGAPQAGAVAAAVNEPAAPKLDAFGRAYATGKRKDAVARVWIKRGSGKITVNGRDVTVYFARPVLRMIINQPFLLVDRASQFDVEVTVNGGLSGKPAPCVTASLP
ncbi:hypothetical protein CCP2SC5_70077 [Azospirillaceae bacterium]